MIMMEDISNGFRSDVQNLWKAQLRRDELIDAMGAVLSEVLKEMQLPCDAMDSAIGEERTQIQYKVNLLAMVRGLKTSDDLFWHSPDAEAAQAVRELKRTVLANFLKIVPMLQVSEEV